MALFIYNSCGLSFQEQYGVDVKHKLKLLSFVRLLFTHLDFFSKGSRAQSIFVHTLFSRLDMTTRRDLFFSDECIHQCTPPLPSIHPSIHTKIYVCNDTVKPMAFH